jgi:hypothetical protein
MKTVQLMQQIDQLKRGDRLLILPFEFQGGVEPTEDSFRSHLAEHGVTGMFAGRRDDTVYVRLANGETVEHDLDEILAVHRA